MRFVVMLGVLLFLPLPAAAGALYGTVRKGAAPAAAVEIFVACPGFDRATQPPASALTDERGSFAVRVTATGRCEMQVRRGTTTGAPFEVFVANNPVRYDFEIDGAMNRVR